MGKKIILAFIRLYQKTISPDHGPMNQIMGVRRCKFYPTCSEYMHRAINRHGLFRGARLGLGRIGRCHPWSAGGIDEVPNVI